MKSRGISPENEKFIQHELECGACPGRGELLDDAVSLLKQRRDFQREPEDDKVRIERALQGSRDADSLLR